LGYFVSEEDAARAYDKAAIYKAQQRKGKKKPAVTNLSAKEYDANEIAALMKLPLREVAARLARGGVDVNLDTDLHSSDSNSGHGSEHGAQLQRATALEGMLEEWFR